MAPRLELVAVAIAGASVVTIAEPGGGNQRELRVAGCSTGWVVNAAGTFSGFLPVTQAWKQGISDYTDYWLKYRAKSGRIFGGVVRETAIRMGQTVELSATSFVDELKNINTFPDYDQGSAPAGTQIRRALTDAPGERAIFDEIKADDAGLLLTNDWKSDNLYQIVDRVARTANLQYTDKTGADWRRTLYVGESVGEDKTGSILLIEGKHFGSGDLVISARNLKNKILAKSADSDWKDAPGVIVLDTDSVELRGARETTVRYYGVHSVSGLTSRARADLVTASVVQIPLSFAVPSGLPELAEIEQGDTIRVWLWSANARYAMTVTQIVEDEMQGKTTLTGKAVVL